MSYWSNNSYYFLTSSTFFHYPYFNLPEQKQIILDQVKKVKKQLDIPFFAYSIARDHYHLCFYLVNGFYHGKVKQIINGGSSYIFRRKYFVKWGKIWESSHTLIVPNEKVFLKVLGYVAGNLLKHREVKDFEELKENLFSSYRQLAKKHGDEFSQNLVRKVIVLDLEEKDEIVEFLSGESSH